MIATTTEPVNPEQPYKLERFVTAQQESYEAALQEMRRGRKESHWMWYIFPQIAGLGSSRTAQFYAISSTAEAEAYLRHPTLGPRLNECAQVLMKMEGRTAAQIFDFPDDMKLRSCMTLFSHICAPDSIFHQVMEKYFNNEEDGRTLDILEAAERERKLEQEQLKSQPQAPE